MRWTRAAPAREGIAGRTFRERFFERAIRTVMACVRQKRVVLATRGWCQAGGDCESPTGLFAIVNSPAMEARRIRLQGEYAISRQPIAQGMPACPGCTCMLVCASSTTIAHETAGAASTRHSLLPLFRGRQGSTTANLGRNKPRERETMSTVIASGAKQSISRRKEKMDCFAALAKTWIGCSVLDTPPSRGMTIQRIFSSVGWVERSDTHHDRPKRRWVSLRSTHLANC